MDKFEQAISDTAYPLSLEQAKEQLRLGKTVQHRYFSDHEYISQQGCMIITEEGYKCEQSEFWKYRQGEGFASGWKIIEK